MARIAPTLNREYHVESLVVRAIECELNKLKPTLFKHMLLQLEGRPSNPNGRIKIEDNMPNLPQMEGQ